MTAKTPAATPTPPRITAAVFWPFHEETVDGAPVSAEGTVVPTLTAAPPAFAVFSGGAGSSGGTTTVVDPFGGTSTVWFQGSLPDAFASTVCAPGSTGIGV